jgi:hypothetical protein
MPTRVRLADAEDGDIRSVKTSFIDPDNFFPGQYDSFGPLWSSGVRTDGSIEIRTKPSGQQKTRVSARIAGCLDAR